MVKILVLYWILRSISINLIDMWTILSSQAMFGWVDFKEDGKKKRENKWVCLVGRERGKNSEIQLFSLQTQQKLISPKWREKWRENGNKKHNYFGLKCPPPMFKVCFDFCHFLIRFLFFLLSSDTSFALLLPFNSSFFLNQKHPFFFLIFFFIWHSLFLCVCLFFLFFFFFFFSHLSLLFSFFFHHFSLICFGFLCSSFIFNEVSNYIQFFNKNIMCNFFYLIRAWE